MKKTHFRTAVTVVFVSISTTLSMYAVATLIAPILTPTTITHYLVSHFNP